MGILDDAIREHLELKRRRGTDPGEIERLEREALGPVRRAGQQPDDLPFDAELEREAGYPDEQPLERRAEAPESGTFTGLGSAEASGEEDDQADWEVPDPGPLGAGLGVEPDVAAPAPPAPPAPASGRTEPDEDEHLYGDDHLDQETLEHSLQDEELPPKEQRQPPERGGSAEPDDMLEETPEFLQDTPDHDRLWFEQRPPRDFDLDG